MTSREKALCWLRHGTVLVWVVEPGARTVTVFRSGRSEAADVRILTAAQALEAPDLLPGFRCAVAQLFAS